MFLLVLFNIILVSSYLIIFTNFIMPLTLIRLGLLRVVFSWGGGGEGGVNLTPCGFFKTVSSTERVKPWFFVTFNIIISHILPEHFIEISQVIQKIWRFSSSILTIFINFSDFFIFSCYKETNDVSI